MLFNQEIQANFRKVVLLIIPFHWLAATFVYTTPIGYAEEIRYDSGGRRDPFTPLVGPDGTIKQAFNPDGLQVEGIIYDPKQGSLALVNGDFFKEGDSIQDVKVLKISRDKITISKEDDIRDLWLRNETEEGEEKDGASAGKGRASEPAKKTSK